MLRKNQRIPRRLFDAVRQKGKNTHTKYLSLVVLSADSFETTDESRFSCVVSKKVAKKAVERNKLRRRYYTDIQSQKKKIKNGFWCIAFFKKGAAELDFTALKDEIDQALKKAGLLK